MELIPSWKQAHLLSSVQLGTAAVVLSAADQWIPAVSAFLPPWLSGLVMAASVIARLVYQPKVAEKVQAAGDRAIK
jgi:hypothetical protein